MNHIVSLSPGLIIEGGLLHGIMEFHNSAIRNKDGKYSCDICGHLVGQKGTLARHKKSVHDGVKFCCSQCNYQANTKGNLARHKRAVHEGVKYPCGQCGKQLTSQSYLDEHKRAVHEGVKYPCR